MLLLLAPLLWPWLLLSDPLLVLALPLVLALSHALWPVLAGLALAALLRRVVLGVARCASGRCRSGACCGVEPLCEQQHCCGPTCEPSPAFMRRHREARDRELLERFLLFDFQPWAPAAPAVRIREVCCQERGDEGVW